MNWQELGRKLAGIGLPALGASVGGPLGAATGRVVAEALGAPDPSPSTIAEAITADPEAAAKLQKLENEMQARRFEHDERIFELETRDVQDARATDRDDRMRRWLAVPLIASPTLFGVYLLWQNPQGEILALGTLILGYLIGHAEKVVAFFYGTSLGSTRRAAEQARERTALLTRVSGNP